MALTDHCDIFASFHEDGFNQIVHHIQRQRPSMFNYATREIASDPRRLCEAISVHPIVGVRGNPLVTIVDPLPIPGSDYGVNFAVQLVDLRIDFHPGDEFPLPPQLAPPLAPQRLAIQLKICGGLGCPPREVVDHLIPPPRVRPERKPERGADPPHVVTPLPFRELTCFCLQAFVVAGIRVRNYDGKPWLEPFLDGLEIVDIRPEGLENAIECYIALMLKLVVLPQLRILLEMAPLDIIKDKVSVSLHPVPTSAAVPNNPAIEDDQLKAFIKLEVS